MNLLNNKLKIKIDWIAYIFILPAIIIFCLFLFYPALWSFICSFKNVKPLMMKNSGLFEIPGTWIGLKNYISIFSNKLFLKSLFNTFIFGIIFIPTTMFTSLFLAILLEKKIWGVSFIRSIFFMPYVLSIISVSLIFMMLFNGDKGFINGLLSYLKVQNIPDWLSNTKLAMPIIAIMSAWRRIGYFMLIYIAGLSSIPDSLYEISDIDGTSKVQKFTMITWPLLRRFNMVILILLLVDSMKIFQEVFVMTGGGPANSTVTIPFLIYNEAFKYLNIGNASSMSYILFMIIFIIVLIQNTYISKKLDY